MLSATIRGMEAPGELQQSFWNGWNAKYGDRWLEEISRRQGELVLHWLAQTGRRDLAILEVGCGSGWLCPELAAFGKVVGTDLADEALADAQRRWPQVRFVAGDFLSLPFEPAAYDVIVSLEALSHVADQPRFIQKISGLLKPSGLLMLATQNRPILQHHCNVPPPAPGQLRRWVDRDELTSLVRPFLNIEELRSVTPISHKGARRLLTSSKVNTALRPLIGDRLRNALEARDWGWTLMLKARKPAAN